ncbi:hypothetical protein TELCIR_04401 [Teladorsagia circumcincta]|uniref:Uncharacterized protein n=1 Tax=Teladorsagia circumcincta TaxID=45464 RepID=A0A2G9UTP7_TELCI|nr:hypothetical protein TELCIR_04401 [Teladorsagia circumcincta]
MTDLYMHLDEESVYETSDEQGPYELEKPSEITQDQQDTQDEHADLEEEDDVVDELAEWKTNYDARPICPLPTPLRKVMIVAHVRLEFFFFLNSTYMWCSNHKTRFLRYYTVSAPRRRWPP